MLFLFQSNEGSVDSLAEIELAGSYNFSPGDKTIDFYTRGYLPLFNDKISVSLDVVPYEWFKTDTITRDKRAARTQSGKGGAGGDIYLYTVFQILRNQQKCPDLALRTSFRLPTGTNLHNARYTDGPGYFFDFSAGKNYALKNNILRIYLMGGFYVYQTFDLQHLQNDCYLYGGGADLHLKKWIISQSIAGYSGYLNIGDKPLVYRASIQLKRNFFDWKVSYQWGLNDYEFQRVRVGAVFHMHFIP
jgi:hypothetical protein